jgi:hypothetical protein
MLPQKNTKGFEGRVKTRPYEIRLGNLRTLR